ncbi:hypothetical protein HJD18_17045 [Thermoleophilia bacterium SCSIO 60948]|nr:hypothetical protein HJD18_17045 [Thermoleophilia bacterium SCSIO 60948]
MEFLGAKRSLLDFLMEVIDGAEVPPGARAADPFCGTAALSSIFRRRGWSVTANDSLALCATCAEAALLFNPSESTEAALYTKLVDELNAVSPVSGFIHANYSPAGGRGYLTEANARRVDAIRLQIEEWAGWLSRGLRAQLLVDLVSAVALVSNTAGTFGCYLKNWKKRAFDPLILRPANSSRGALGPGPHQVHCDDAQAVVSATETELLYIDPPYTKRQYAAYYHLLETIVLYDSPVLVGSTGLRPWKEKASAWCYKARAPAALDSLVASARCRHLFFSYNEDGQIPHGTVMEILQPYGELSVHETEYRRYRSSARPHKGRHLTERLYHLQMD